MIERRSFLVGSLLLCASTPAFAQARRLRVVASFTILADLVHQIGSERVNIVSLVPPDGDAHGFEYRPQDAKTVSEADLLVINGLNFESWADRLLKTSQFKGERLVASRGIQALSIRNQIDPHAWHDVANVEIYAANIRDTLIRLDPAGREIYSRRADAYIARLRALDSEIKAQLNIVPANRRRVVTSHDAFNYFGDAYGIAFYAPLGLSTEAAAGAQNIARLIRQIKDEKIQAIFLENMSDPRLAKRLSAETGVKIGGTLFSDSLGKGAPTYIAMMRHNARTLSAALS